MSDGGQVGLVPSARATLLPMTNVWRLTLGDGGETARPSPPSRKILGDGGGPPDSVGQELCKARHRQGKDLIDIWYVLKIRPDHLVAIEEGRFDALPGRVYLIGYVRSYAAYLGLDADRLVERLRTELDGPTQLDGPDPATGSPLALLPAVTERVMRLPRLQSGTVIAGLLLVAFVYSGYYAFASIDRGVETRVMPVPARLLAAAGLPQKTAIDLPPTPVEPRVPVQQQTPIAPPPEPLPPVPPEVAVTPPAPAPVIVLAPEPAPKIARAKLPAGKRYGTRNKNSRITLRVHRPTYVAVQGTRNRSFLDRVLWPGDTYRVPNMVGLRLSSPDAGAVELILDGSSMGFVGRDGANLRGLLLNPQSIVDRQQRG